MRLSRPLFIGVGLIAALFLFLVFTLCFIPDRELQALAARALQHQGYSLRAGRFGKAFPLGVQAVNLEIADDRGVLLKAEKAAIRLNLLPLLAGRLTISAQAVIGAGQVAGDYSPRGGDTQFELRGVRLEDLPFIQTVTGARAKGVMRLQGHVKGTGKGPTGLAQLEIKGANLSGVKIGEMPLPDADYRTVQGMARASAGILTLESFTLEGEGLYVRLKGDFPLTAPPGAAPLNLTLELMPKPEFLERQKFVFLLLTKYLTTPGRYEIPIRGTLAKPAIQ
jgi:type II secretion system protein N